ncbi:MAG: hypothetical protein RL660_1735 [Bacteroidota bacterium]|jgi:hypothetical protein
MKNFFALATLVLVNLTAFCQLPRWDWAKNIVTSSGYISEALYVAASDNQGNLIVAGNLLSPSMSFDSISISNTSNAYYSDGYITKYSKLGTALWAVQLKGTLHEYPCAIATDASGNIFVCGYFNSPNFTAGNVSITNSGGDDVFLLKLSSNGSVTWLKKIGDAGNEKSFAVCVNRNNEIIVTGEFASSSLEIGSNNLANKGGLDVFVAKFDNNGNSLLSMSFGGTGNEFCTGVASDNANSFVITGNFFSPSIDLGGFTLSNTGMSSMFIIKYDSQANLMWADKWSGGSTNKGQGLAIDNNNNIILLGFYNENSVSFSGNITTTCQYPHHAITKYNPNGTAVWAKVHAEAKIEANKVDVDNAGNVMVFGSFNCPQVSFGSSLLVKNNGGSTTLALAKYDSLGNEVVAIQANGNSSEYTYGLAADKTGSVYVGGITLSDSINFGTTTLYNTGSGQSRSYIAKASFDSALFVLSNSDISLLPSRFCLYPNPTNNQCSIDFKSYQQEALLSIYSTTGQLMFKERFSGRKRSLQLDQFANGEYFVQVEVAGHKEVHKISVIK